MVFSIDTVTIFLHSYPSTHFFGLNVNAGKLLISNSNCSVGMQANNPLPAVTSGPAALLWSVMLVPEAFVLVLGDFLQT